MLDVYQDSLKMEKKKICTVKQKGFTFAKILVFKE